MIVAIIALVAALGGTAIAGSGFVTTKKFKKFKKTALTQLTYVNNSVTVTPSNSTGFDGKQVTATCPSGQHPLGGGVKLQNNDELWWDDGYLTPTGYASRVFNYTGSDKTALVTVACVTAKKTTGAPIG
jgi:hypothetical protein